LFIGHAPLSMNGLKELHVNSTVPLNIDFLIFRAILLRYF